MSKIEKLIEAAKTAEIAEDDFAIVRELAKIRSRRASIQTLIQSAKLSFTVEDDYCIVLALKEMSL